MPGARVTNLIARARGGGGLQPPTPAQVARAKRDWDSQHAAGTGPPRFGMRGRSCIATCWSAVFQVLLFAMVACAGVRGLLCGGPPACSACTRRIVTFLEAWVRPMQSCFRRGPVADDFADIPDGELARARGCEGSRLHDWELKGTGAGEWAQVDSHIMSPVLRCHITHDSCASLCAGARPFMMSAVQLALAGPQALAPGALDWWLGCRATVLVCMMY